MKLTCYDLQHLKCVSVSLCTKATNEVSKNLKKKHSNMVSQGCRLPAHQAPGDVWSQSRDVSGTNQNTKTFVSNPLQPTVTKKLRSGAPGRTSRGKDATNGAPGITTSSILTTRSSAQGGSITLKSRHEKLGLGSWPATVLVRANTELLKKSMQTTIRSGGKTIPAHRRGHFPCLRGLVSRVIE